VGSSSRPEDEVELPKAIAGGRRFALDGAVLAFDRRSGLSALCDGPHTAHLTQRAPRVVLFGITNRCNLACGYCSRDLEADSDWTTDSAFQMLSRLADFGVLEVAFGGGEPLAFRGFDELVTRLHDQTPLAVGFTTNGALLDARRLARLAGKVSQIRVSLHGDDSAAFRALRLLGDSSLAFGANVIVTPERLARFEDLVIDLIATGCRDVLVLSYNGPDEALHLDAQAALDLGRRLRALAGALGPRLAFGLGGCWGARLGAGLRLETRAGCGAGRDFVTISSDRRVHACSFHEQGFEARTADDVMRVWRERASALGSPAHVRGCTRTADEQLALVRQRPPAPAKRIRLFQSFASNNSGVYSLLGSFRKLETLTEVAELFRELARAQAAWQDAAESLPQGTPPVLAADTELWDYDFSQVSVETLGHQIFVHTPYTVTMPDALQALIVRKGGQIAIEIDHAHHPIVALFSFWLVGGYSQQNREDRQRRHALVQAELTPVIEELRKPRYNEAPAVPPAWRDEDYGITLGLVVHDLPEALRRARLAADHAGLNVVLRVFEALSPEGDPLAELRYRNPEGHGRFQVALWSAGAEPLRVMKALREGLGGSLEEAKQLALSAPSVIVEHASETKARALAEGLTRVGADAEALGPADFTPHGAKR
jgi:MoaA/NifB/PqqE/SkfB family radical SAM enzyme/ribosomal protein L7/L12